MLIVALLVLPHATRPYAPSWNLVVPASRSDRRLAGEGAQFSGAGWRGGVRSCAGFDGEGAKTTLPLFASFGGAELYSSTGRTAYAQPLSEIEATAALRNVDLMNRLKEVRDGVVLGQSPSEHQLNPSLAFSTRAFADAVRADEGLHRECLEVLDALPPSGGASPSLPDLTSLDVKQLISGGDRSRELLVERNMKLIEHVVGKELRRRSAPLNSLTRCDLVQEGSIGLMRAIDRFSPSIAESSSCSFATYATYWIRAAVLRAIAERDDVIRTPFHVSETIRRIVKAEKSAWGEFMDAKKLAEETGFRVSRVNDALAVMKRRRNGGYVEFTPNYHDNAESFKSSEGDLRGASGVGWKGELEGALGKFLRPQELQAISLRYGLAQADRDETDAPPPRLRRRSDERARILRRRASRCPGPRQGGRGEVLQGDRHHHAGFW